MVFGISGCLHCEQFKQTATPVQRDAWSSPDPETAHQNQK